MNLIKGKLTLGLESGVPRANNGCGLSTEHPLTLNQQRCHHFTLTQG